MEKKNRTLQEMDHVMLNSKKLSQGLWAKAINMACHTINYVYLLLGTKMTPYEIWKGKKPNVGYFHIFGSTCYILNDHENLGKFDSKSNVGVFLGYFNNSRTYHVYDMRTQTIMKSANIVVDNFNAFFKYSREEVINSFTDEAIVESN